MDMDATQTFGWSFLQFARSVDNLHDEILDGMKELASAYFLRKSGLGACYFCVLRTGAMFEGMPAFQTEWSSDPRSETQVVRRYRDGSNIDESPSLRALAFNRDRCLWVTVDRDMEGEKTTDGATLDSVDPKRLVDHWREHSGKDEEQLPSYIHMHDKPCRTLVALPLKHHGLKLGVLVIEFDRQIPITAGARQEAELIREALGRILWLQDASKAQQEGTRKAFEELKKVVSDSWSSVDPPTMFFAYPESSDKNLTNTVEEILQIDYSDRLVLLSWNQMSSPGQITDQIVEEISRCRYGICYLSELVEDSEQENQQRYVDNPNVLIEAGMLHALRNSRLAPTTAWMPIREADDRTEAVPFDFVAERMLQVPREEDGTLRIERFKEEFKKGIDALIEA
jgi:hypothetical protein